MGRFKTWLEATKRVEPNAAKKYVFLDMDDTLIHGMEEGWLKECPGNDDYIPLLVAGKPPYPDIKLIPNKDRKIHVFPRPRLQEFLENISAHAACYIFTHNAREYAEKVIKEYGLGKWIKGAFSAPEQEPDSLGKKFDLKNSQWVLVDNMPNDCLELTQKFRILGICFPDAANPNEEGKRIVKEGRDHFVNISSWYPTVDEHADNGLFQVLPKINEKLGIL